jgi:hypothetical protein
MPYRFRAEAVLAKWREVERELAGVLPGSPEAEHLAGEAARLRDEYAAVIEAAKAEEPPIPPPFPDAASRA